MAEVGACSVTEGFITQSHVKGKLGSSPAGRKGDSQMKQVLIGLSLIVSTAPVRLLMHDGKGADLSDTADLSEVMNIGH